MFARTEFGAVGEFAASRHGVITRKQAAEYGIHRNVVARLKHAGHLREPAPGVLVVGGSPATWRQRLLVATLASSASSVAGFRSAAVLHVCDGYKEGRRPELLAPSWRRTAALLATVHEGPMDPADITEIDGIPCTGIARTLCDLGSVDTVANTRRAFESMWRAGTSLVWIRQTAERLHRPGQRGTRVILDLLDEAEALGRPTESSLELELEACLVGIPSLVRQHTIRDRGRFVARVDFAVLDARLAIEAHSREFHFGPTAGSRDEAREHEITRVGWDVMYFGAARMKKPAQVRAEVLAVVNRRIADLRAA